jgi:predicted O-linked N-acetylglucosamine transferase (SPINDLY family)
LPASGFVFCCFNNNFKIQPPLFDVWMRLLREVGGSVLWLFEDNAAASRNLRREAAARGIDADRLVFAKWAKLENYLAQHRQADLFLDTFPYNAHATASHALWAGLPMVTCAGGIFASRVGASLLNAAGLPDLIAHSPEEYEQMALTLARDPKRLAEVKARLARNRSTCPLFDTTRFTRHLEDAYRQMWSQYEGGGGPDHIVVQARS